MRWIQTLKAALLAAAALAPVGCVELEPKTKPTDKPPPATQQDDPPADKPPPPKKAERPPPDDTDPVVTAAELSARRLADYEERIDAGLTALTADLAALSGADVRAVDLTAEKLLAVVQQLRASGERILDRYPQVKGDLAGIGKANAGVKVGYTRAREVYLEKADLEGGDLKDRYLTLADLCDAFVRTADERTAQYAAFAKDLDKAVAKVERHVAFLKDFEAFLKINPGTQGAKERADFLGTLAKFAEQVIRFGDVLKQFRDQVRDGAVSMKLRAEHDKAVAAARAECEAAEAAARAEQDRSAAAARSEPDGKPSGEGPPAAKPMPTEPLATSATTTPPSVSTPVNVPVATPCPTPVRFVPVVTTRCVPTLVPVTDLSTHHGPCGCRTVAVTRYEWRTRLVTETCYATAPD
jgi:hypothetical protein